MHAPIETSELLAFAKTVESQSLSRAAVELAVPRATISRRLARLESRLGTRLLRRTTRSLTLTEAGQALLAHARIVLEAVGNAEASIRAKDSVLRGDLRIAVPPMLQPGFPAMICDFARQHPEVRVQVHASAPIVDLRREGFDVAIRASRELEPGLIARTLLRDRLVAVAAPAYLAEKGVPRTRRELRHHRCLMGFERNFYPASHWPTAGGGKVHVEGSFYSNEMQLLCEAALNGLGIAMLPQLIAGPLLESGALVPVLPEVLRADVRVAVVYPEREFLPLHVRAFIDAVIAWAPGAFSRTLGIGQGGGSSAAPRVSRARS